MLKPSPLSFVLSLIVTAAAAWLWESVPHAGVENTISSRILVSHVAVLDPSQTALLLDRDVWIGDGVIQSVVPSKSGNVQPAAGTLVLDGRGRTLLPGLIDTAVFASLDGSLPEDRLPGAFRTSLNIDLQAGACTVVDLNASRAQIRDTQLRDQALEFPRLRLAAGLLTSRGGWRAGEKGDGSSPAFEVSNPEDLELAFKSDREDGAGLVFASVENVARDDAAISQELLERLGRLCRAADLPLVIHVEHPSKALAALAASPCLLLGAWASESVTPEVLSSLLKSGCAYAPALQSLMGFLPPHDIEAALKGVSRSSWLPPQLLDSLGNWPAMLKYARRFALAHDSPEMAAGNLAMLAGAGVPIVLGSMSGMPGLPHGPALGVELGRLVDAGLTPRQAIDAATLNGARALKLEGLGCMARGCQADLLLVEGDPSRGLGALRRPVAVIRGGRILDKSP